MKTSRTHPDPVLRHGSRIFGKHRGVLHDALLEAHAAAVLQVDGRDDQHAGRAGTADQDARRPQLRSARGSYPKGAAACTRCTGMSKPGGVSRLRLCPFPSPFPFPTALEHLRSCRGARRQVISRLRTWRRSTRTLPVTGTGTGTGFKRVSGGRQPLTVPSWAARTLESGRESRRPSRRSWRAVAARRPGSSLDETGPQTGSAGPLRRRTGKGRSVYPAMYLALRRGRIVAVDEVEAAAVRDARPQRVRARRLHLVPAHVRHLQPRAVSG